MASIFLGPNELNTVNFKGVWRECRICKSWYCYHGSKMASQWITEQNIFQVCHLLVHVFGQNGRHFGIRQFQMRFLMKMIDLGCCDHYEWFRFWSHFSKTEIDRNLFPHSMCWIIEKKKTEMCICILHNSRATNHGWKLKFTL